MMNPPTRTLPKAAAGILFAVGAVLALHSPASAHHAEAVCASTGPDYGAWIVSSFGQPDGVVFAVTAVTDLPAGAVVTWRQDLQVEINFIGDSISGVAHWSNGFSAPFSGEGDCTYEPPVETTEVDTTLPDTTLPDTTIVETTEVETTLVETTEPDTTAVETTEPDTTIPDTTEVPPSTENPTTTGPPTVPPTTADSVPPTSAPATSTPDTTDSTVPTGPTVPSVPTTGGPPSPPPGDLPSTGGGLSAAGWGALMLLAGGAVLFGTRLSRNPQDGG